MKKILLITLIVLALGALVWIFIFPRSSTPIIDQIQDYLPFGKGSDAVLPTETDNGAFGQFGEGNTQAPSPRDTLFQISTEPVAGATFVTSSTSVSVRYAERATGHIYDFDLNTFEKSKVTNQTLPKIYEALFNTTGNKVIYRSINDAGKIENTSLTLTPPKPTDPEGSLYTIAATILRNDVTEMVAGPSNILYYMINDGTTLISSDFEGGNVKNILSTPFNNWRISPYGGRLAVWTKASATTPGYAYNINLSTGVLEKIVGPANGLTINLSPSNNDYIYTFNEGGRTRLLAASLAVDDNTEVSPTTLAEKCAWSNKTRGELLCGTPSSIRADEPDNWYKGVTQFSDNIWSFNTYSEENYLLAEPKTLLGVDIDVYQPKVSPNDDYLIFINKRDLSLWGLKIE
jgi:hypothetical protein